MGQNKWNNLSESERQTQIIKLKLQNRRLRHQNKREEANKLFGDIIHDPGNYSMMYGMHTKGLFAVMNNSVIFLNNEKLILFYVLCYTLLTN